MASKHIELSQLEKDVVSTLARVGPMCGYDFHLGGQRVRRSKRAMMSSGYWIKLLKHIGPNGLNIIREIDLPRVHSTDERGRRKDLYWLTDKGILFALGHDADTKSLLANVRRIYPDMPQLAFLIEMKETVGEKVFNFMLNEYMNIDWNSPKSKDLLYLAIHGWVKARDLDPTSDPDVWKRNFDLLLKKYEASLPDTLEAYETVKSRLKQELDRLLSD